MKLLRFLICITMLAGSISSAEVGTDLSLLLGDARKGDVEAMCDLGVSYFNGKGTLKDPFKAKCWIKKAYDNGSKRAEKLWNKFELWQYSGKCETSFDDEQLSKYTKGMQYTEPVTGMKFVYIPQGCFMMGCYPMAEKCKKDENPVHKVCVSGFWMGIFEVSQEQWQRVMGENPSRFTGKANHPVENVSFDDIKEFILLLNSNHMERFSLPSEAQWEYACRNGGKKVGYPWGNESYRPDANCGICNSGEYHGETAPVGSFFPNQLGLYDMGGNVKEWCQDVYHKKAYVSHTKKNPLTEANGSSRVVRGGSFSDNTSKLRCISRDQSISVMRSDNLGFRLVLTRDN